MTPIAGAAAIGHGERTFSLAEIVEDAPGPGEVRVRIAAAGMCHTDLASLRWAGPLVLGHEGAGYVDAIGPCVEGFRARHAGIAQLGDTLPALTHLYRESAGGHDWNHWTREVENSLRFFGSVMANG